MSRLIDADELKEKAWDADTRCGYVQVVDVGDIDDAPTIKPESNCSEIPNGWIPCTPETMPEEHEWLGTKKFGTTISDEVYVTFENPNGERFCKHLSFQNGELSHYDKHCIDVWCKGSKPIAWMPLPTPYQPKEDES